MNPLLLFELFFVVLVAVLGTNAHAARILMIPYMNGSHFLQLDGVGRPLVDRGHKVHVLLDSNLSLKSNRYSIITYGKHNVGNSTCLQMMSPEFQTKYIETTPTALQSLPTLQAHLKIFCIEMLSDDQLFLELRQLKFDLVIVDNFFVNCFYLIPYKLGVPYVAVGAITPAWYLRLPVLPSVVQPFLGLDFFGITMCEESPGQLSFVRRTCRLIAHVMQEKFLTLFEEEYLREFVEFPSIAEIRENASMTLINQTPLLSSALPKLPHVEYVGGITTTPPKPLSKDLEDWMLQNKNVIVVSFGSRFPSLPAAILEKLFDAFRHLPQYRFLFRFKPLDSNRHVQIPKNVRTMDWLPQNDALGHESTVAFVTHSGYNGQTEALYHGVPMLCFYVAADQKSNALRSVTRGFAKMLNLHDFEVDDFVANLSEIIVNPIYAANIKKASRIFHSEQHPSLRAADAVEHVLKYGSAHLRPVEAYKLRWWEFYMLDVMGMLYVSALLVVYLAFKTLRCVLRCFSCRRKTAHQESQSKAKKE